MSPSLSVARVNCTPAHLLLDPLHILPVANSHRSRFQNMASQSIAPETYPPVVDESQRARLVEVIKDWTIANGLTVRPPPTLLSADSDPGGVLATSVPVTLFPSPFPRICFEQARTVQRAYNDLYARVSQDVEFLNSMVKE